MNAVPIHSTVRGVGVNVQVKPPPLPTARDVIQAIKAGPLIDTRTQMRVPRKRCGYDLFGRLAELRDNVKISFGAGSRPPAANSIEVRSFDQLLALLPVFYGVAAGRGFPVDGFERELDGAKLHHLQQQGEAIMSMGAGGAYFGIKFARHHRRQGDRLVYQFYVEPFGLETTKLGLAAIAAAPEKPSQTSNEDLYAMGYVGVADAAARIAEHNRRSGWQLPSPPSCNPVYGLPDPPPEQSVLAF
jgi:hypothetical protein